MSSRKCLTTKNPKTSKTPKISRGVYIDLEAEHSEFTDRGAADKSDVAAGVGKVFDSGTGSDAAKTREMGRSQESFQL